VDEWNASLPRDPQVDRVEVVQERKVS